MEFARRCIRLDAWKILPRAPDFRRLTSAAHARIRYRSAERPREWISRSGRCELRLDMFLRRDFVGGILRDPLFRLRVRLEWPDMVHQAVWTEHFDKEFVGRSRIFRFESYFHRAAPQPEYAKVSAEKARVQRVFWVRNER